MKKTPPLPDERTPSRAFLEACTQVQLAGFQLCQHLRHPGDKPFVILQVCRYNPLTGQRISDREVRQPVDVQVVNYRSTVEVDKVFFSEFLHAGSPSHIKTFLAAIKPKSTISFQVLAFNQNGNLNEIGWSGHRLTGIVDNQSYLLIDYAGPQNLASPVRVTNLAA